jgi:hypothetical protein
MVNNFNFEANSPKNPFKIPDGYFEDFILKIERKITHVEISPWQKNKTYLYIAAMFVMIFSLGAIFVQKNALAPKAEAVSMAMYDEESQQMLIESVDEDVIIDYILAHNK